MVLFLTFLSNTPVFVPACCAHALGGNGPLAHERWKVKTTALSVERDVFGRGRLFSGTVRLPYGKHLFRFLVDGTWRHDPQVRCARRRLLRSLPQLTRHHGCGNMLAASLHGSRSRWYLPPVPRASDRVCENEWICEGCAKVTVSGIACMCTTLFENGSVIKAMIRES